MELGQVLRWFDAGPLRLLPEVRDCGQLRLYCESAFNGNFGATTVPVVLLGTYAFAWQIYGDFAGYSNIARGAAQLLGFHFMVNFRQPYLATTLQDFWRRWHISLSTWLRDYLYIPLGGNRKGGADVKQFHTTMLLGGLWHGANWTFVIWGGIHGAGLAAERMLKGTAPVSPAGPGLGGWTWRVVVFHFVCLTWIFFRAPTFSSAATMLAGLGVLHWEHVYGIAANICYVRGSAAPGGSGTRTRKRRVSFRTPRLFTASRHGCGVHRGHNAVRSQLAERLHLLSVLGFNSMLLTSVRAIRPGGSGQRRAALSIGLRAAAALGYLGDARNRRAGTLSGAQCSGGAHSLGLEHGAPIWASRHRMVGALSWWSATRCCRQALTARNSTHCSMADTLSVAMDAHRKHRLPRLVLRRTTIARRRIKARIRSVMSCNGRS